jgi:hypothetical protein
MDLVLERRDPGRIILVDLPGEVDECLLVLFRLDGTDGEGGAAHRAGASGWMRQAPVKLETPKSRHYVVASETFSIDL